MKNWQRLLHISMSFVVSHRLTRASCYDPVLQVFRLKAYVAVEVIEGTRHP